jgi:outer membrane protein OmpA-like peptidoglycan-associated protein
MYRLFTAIIFCIALLNTSFASAQEYADKPFDQRPSYGIFGGVNINTHISDMTGISGFNSCVFDEYKYTGGTGIGFAAGLFYSFPILNDWDLTIRAVYNTFDAELTTQEPTYVVGRDGFGTSATIDYSIQAYLSAFSIEPLMSWRMSNHVSLHMGFRAGTMLTKQFDQIEEITSPSYGTFVDTKTRTRNEYTGEEITDGSSIEAAAVVGISYSLPMNKANTLMLEPEAYYSFGITPVASDLSWTIHALKAGIALRYAPRELIPVVPPPPPPPAPPLPAPPPPPVMPVLDAYITAVSVMEDGTESPVTTINVEEYSSTRVHPLLNYIFFDENKSVIPNRYVNLSAEEKEQFSDKYLENMKTFEVYYRVLNIVGNRMNKFPGAELTLTGCNSNLGTEKNNLTLSRSRAQTVKDFLTSVWGVGAERIKIVARNLPQIPSNQARVEGQIENRRVEMTSNFDQIFAPVKIADTRRTTDPPLIRFKPVVKSDVGVAEWKLITSQSGQVLKIFSGVGDVPAKIELDLTEDQTYVPQLDEPYEYSLEVTDNDNKVWNSKIQELPVKANTIQSRTMALMDGEAVDEKEFYKLSLISFAYNKFALTKEHLPIVNDAKRLIQEESKVRIEGYTDNLGDERLNQIVSQNRAESAAKGLGVNKRNAKGFGSQNPFYTNDLPEGRLYNRTVYIEIENTIEF